MSAGLLSCAFEVERSLTMTGVKSSSNSILDFLLLRGKAEILANVFSSSDSSLCLLASFFLFRSFPPAGRVHGEQQGATVGDDQHRLQALVHDGVLQDLAEPGVQGDVQQVQPQGRDLLQSLQSLRRLEIQYGVAGDEEGRRARPRTRAPAAARTPPTCVLLLARGTE